MRPEELLFKLENPQVHTGKEINVIRKGTKKEHINICLVFPDKYEIGMSHYGIKVLYHTLNRMEYVNAERCFLPEKNSIKTFKKFKVIPDVPKKLGGLYDIAYNAWLYWNPDAIKLFLRMDEELWNKTHHNPIKMITIVNTNIIILLLFIDIINLITIYNFLFLFYLIHENK